MLVIAGPCQLESYQHGVDSALFINERLSKYNVKFVFKTSFDKANRTSQNSERGAGIDTLIEVFDHLYQHNIMCLTDVHSVEQVSLISEFCDVIQIPALLSRQTDLIAAAGNTGKIVNIKKGQFMSPHDMKHAALKAGGAREVWITERGTTFGYNNLVVDFRSLIIMKEENPNAKIIFDCTHSTQRPTNQGESSGGERKFALPLAKAARAVGVDGLFLETHHDPDRAPSDGPCMIHWNHLDRFFEKTLF